MVRPKHGTPDPGRDRRIDDRKTMRKEGISAREGGSWTHGGQGELFGSAIRNDCLNHAGAGPVIFLSSIYKERRLSCAPKNHPEICESSGIRNGNASNEGGPVAAGPEEAPRSALAVRVRRHG